jgi:hypothetical protein
MFAGIDLPCSTTCHIDASSAAFVIYTRRSTQGKGRRAWGLSGRRVKEASAGSR